jgi:hypothetical protein
VEVSLGSQEKALWLRLGEQDFKVTHLPVTLAVETRSLKIPLTIREYRQEAVDGVLAWIASAVGQVGDKQVGAHIIFRPDATGFLQPSAVLPNGSDSLQLYFSPDRQAIEAFLKE